MTHNILDGRFFSTRPAWHKLGQISAERLPALEVHDRLNMPRYEMVPAIARIDNGPFGTQDLESNYRLIVRSDPALGQSVVGAVSSEYELIAPRDVAEQWDANVRDSQGGSRHVETMGLLASDLLFVSSYWGNGADPFGDEVKSYLLVSVPLAGQGAAKILPTSVRVVCANTHAMALNSAGASYTVRHDKGAVKRLGLWLSTVSRTAETAFAEMMEAYNKLAQYQLTDETLNSLLDELFALTPLPAFDPMVPYTIAVDRAEKIESDNKRQAQRRSAALDLFNGALTGYRPEMAGSAYALFAGVQELFQFANQRAVETAWESAHFGTRAASINQAFQIITKEVGL